MKSVTNQDEFNLAYNAGEREFEIYGSSQVRAYGSSHVRAYGSSQVTAYDSSQVTAYDSSQVRAYGSSQVTASKFVAVTIIGNPKVEGGHQIRLPAITNATEWCEFYGVEVAKGIVILHKAVDANYISSRGFAYVPGTQPKASDWDGGIAECGNGLHFCATPHHALWFNPDAKKFVACPIALADIVVHLNAVYPSKIKAPGCCAPVWECDINGNKIEQQKPEAEKEA